ncbi:low molecular weight protein tyrosine phosphatase family protein [Fontibacillus panacisegetis]|uniref:low molecular weight protein tyrosine phosphatase family protein n=1 Tax=Fontibacillus panacisegetis TaxID=670482 RepID=UPI001587BA56|nr:protein tyrosine phosphatase [Fontibacillus panacisegetis]
MKLLFVCSRNKWRSLTAEKIFSGLAAYQVRSAGTEENARVKVTAGHIGWADIIFVMEKKHQAKLQQRYREELQDKRVIRLDIPDEYEYMDEELIDLLISRVSEHININI